jgi:hypothetical protein
MMIEKTPLVTVVLFVPVPTTLQKTDPPVIPGINSTLLHIFDCMGNVVEDVLPLAAIELKFSVLENCIS